MKTISLIGSTGSIGTQTLEVCKKHNIRVKALAAKRNVTLLAEQAHKFNAEYVCVFDEKKYDELKKLMSDTDAEVLCGMDGLCKAAQLDNIDLFVNSVVGMVGLLPTLKAIEAGIDVALANKETLVAGGELVMRSAAEKRVKIYPIDSEHSAIFQCLQGNDPKQLHKIILTASGGPFFGKTKDELKNVTVEQALNHPNWSMGSKITIDSATLMNKGLEFIEAKWLFDVKPENIEIVVNRESVLHSAVEFDDYSVIGQLGTPDMKIPIQLALTYPERCESLSGELSLTDYGNLTFAKPDYDTFVCLKTAVKAAEAGGTAGSIVNGANERAVELFLDGKIGFGDIGRGVSGALESIAVKPADTLDTVLEADAMARAYIDSRFC